MIEKKYRDIDAGWFTPDQEAVAQQLGRLFDDVEAALTEIQVGHTVQTPHALYRQVLDSTEEATDGGQIGQHNSDDVPGDDCGGGPGESACAGNREVTA